MANEFRMQSSEMVRTLPKKRRLQKPLDSLAHTDTPITHTHTHSGTGMLMLAALQLLLRMPTCVACKEFPINFNWHPINISSWDWDWEISKISI